MPTAAAFREAEGEKTSKSGVAMEFFHLCQECALSGSPAAGDSALAAPNSHLLGEGRL